ncbi:methyltransferase family protein [Rhizobium sp. PP-WC-2G-219]|uniref:class I SAM-dependent methyltransferase n=1 Tax=Rhizobium sp. PP-CC-3G-465 TaxID=2135648 RepID=UPI000D9D56F3|nr:methyltransferase family protein [Rhizobium sp. PP-WC-1G-195]TCL89669.1 methyltransferase family protein [Rhizobium sp. PP-WC-2G-219]TCQ14802.1 methyltransferase family protein [Rhizobium sp. PP-CC-3G-465]
MSDVISLEEGRRAFGANSEAYNDARPDYPPRVYDILRDQGAVSQTARVFEIGAGTGQATAPLLALGCTITAIEPDARLATTLGNRLRPYGSSLTIVQSSFEDSLLPSASFDLGAAAMAFHWLQQDSALAKVFRLLRPGGWWAMWWTVFGDPADMDPFQRRTQALFQPLSRTPSHAGDSNRPFALDKDARMAELKAAGFGHATYEEIRWNPTLTTRQVVGLTATFSPVTRLPEAERSRFLNELGRIANEEFDGKVRRNFVTAIYLARKPEELSRKS